jgi:hypothetical protein
MHAVQILPATVRCIHVVDIATEGGFTGLAILPRLSIALFEFEFLGKDLFLKLAPSFQTTVLYGLLLACNWFIEIVNSYSLALSLTSSQVCAVVCAS